MCVHSACNRFFTSSSKAFALIAMIGTVLQSARPIFLISLVAQTIHFGIIISMKIRSYSYSADSPYYINRLLPSNAVSTIIPSSLRIVHRISLLSSLSSTTRTCFPLSSTLSLFTTFSFFLFSLSI